MCVKDTELEQEVIEHDVSAWLRPRMAAVPGFGQTGARRACCSGWGCTWQAGAQVPGLPTLLSQIHEDVIRLETAPGCGMLEWQAATQRAQAAVAALSWDLLLSVSVCTALLSDSVLGRNRF